MHFFYGDGYDGLPSYAPFDKILVTAAAPEVPENLLRQLRPGGILVIPVGDEVQTMLRIRRVSQDEFETSRHGSFVFVPFVKGKV